MHSIMHEIAAELSKKHRRLRFIYHGHYPRKCGSMSVDVDGATRCTLFCLEHGIVHQSESHWLYDPNFFDGLVNSIVERIRREDDAISNHRRLVQAQQERIKREQNEKLQALP